MKRFIAPLLVFAVTTAVYESCLVKGPGDLFWSLPTALSLIREGNVDLDEFAPSFENGRGTKRETGRAVESRRRPGRFHVDGEEDVCGEAEQASWAQLCKVLARA